MKKLIALFLVFCMALCLTACTTTTTVEEYDTTASAEVETADDTVETAADDAEEIPTEIPAEAEEDVIAYLTDGLYTKDSVVAETPYGQVTMQDVMYQAAYQYMYYSYMYSMYGMTLNLTDDAGDGTTVAEYMLNIGRSSAIDMLAAYSKAQEYGITPTDEQMQELETMTEQNIQDSGESLWEYYVSSGIISEDDYDDEAKAAWIEEHGADYYYASMMCYGCTAEGIADMYEMSYYINNLQEYLFGENGTNAMSSGELSDAIDSYIADNGLIWGRCILFNTTDAEDSAASAEIAEQAQAAYETLSGTSSGELSDAFTEMQTTYDESGYTPGEVQYYSSSDSLVDGFYDGLASLEPGEVGITDETDYGYFILLREQDNPDDISETVQSSYESETYYALLDEWIEEYGLSTDQIAPDLDAQAVMEKVAELQTIIGNMDFS